MCLSSPSLLYAGNPPGCSFDQLSNCFLDECRIQKFSVTFWVNIFISVKETVTLLVTVIVSLCLAVPTDNLTDFGLPVGITKQLLLSLTELHTQLQKELLKSLTCSLAATPATEAVNSQHVTQVLTNLCLSRQFLQGLPWLQEKAGASRLTARLEEGTAHSISHEVHGTWEDSCIEVTSFKKH